MGPRGTSGRAIAVVLAASAVVAGSWSMGNAGGLAGARHSAAAGGLARAGEGASADRVLVFLVDRVPVEAIRSADVAAIRRIFEDGAVGLVAPTGPDPGGAAAYASVGAGAAVPADVVGTLGGLAFEPGEPLDGGTAAEVWAALFGALPPEGGLVVPYLPWMRQEAAGRRPSAVLGALGDALHAAGMRTAVVGDADAPGGLAVPLGTASASEPLPPGVVRLDLKRHRAAALVVADGRGLVDVGAVGTPLALVDREAPGARRTDPEAFAAAVVEALGAAEVVVADPGDLTRADLDGGSPDDVDAALETADAILAAVIGAVPERTMVVVGGLAPSGAMLARGETLVPIAVWLPGRFEGGLLRSGTTRVPGLVTAADLGPTILDALGVPVPGTMRARPLRLEDGREGSDLLAREAERARVRAASAPGWAAAFAAAAALALLAAATATRRLAPAVASVPTWALLVHGPSPWFVLLTAAALALVVWWAAGRRGDRLLLTIQVWCVTAAVLLVDLAWGADLQRRSPFGPDLSTRPGSWFGDGAIGLVAAGVLLACRAVAAGSLALTEPIRPRPALRFAAAAVAAVGAALVVGLVGGSVAGAAVVAAAGLAGTWAGAGASPRVGRLVLVGIAGLALAAGVAALGSLGDGPLLWDRTAGSGWGETLGVLGARAAEAARAAVTDPWLLVVALSGFVLWDAWPRLPGPARLVAAAAWVPAGVALLATDAGAAAAGWLAVFVCTVVAAASPRPDLEPGPAPAPSDPRRPLVTSAARD